ncbi:MAG TPA: peptidase T [Bacteroidales bacterium]|nr:peptidase T [Bacteroidales bacterium]
MENHSDLVNRFLKYTRVDTRSDANSPDCPSTPGQKELGALLLRDLAEAGCIGMTMDENGYVSATLPANVSTPAPVIGLLAHMDTSPDFSGRNVKARIINDYDGNPILLDVEGKHSLGPAEFPELTGYIGQDLIVTDGRTLLGADNKAGIAEIIEALLYLSGHPEIPHGTVRIAFTPDEEIGRGPDRFDVKAFGADFAYTVDGGQIGELEYENFNAAGVQVRIQGRNVHPGTAKDKMINALQIAIEFHALLPEAERPEKTEGYDGFYHLTKIEGSVDSARLEYIIRDHDRDRFNEKKKLITNISDSLNAIYKPGTVECTLRDQYFNMSEKIEPVMYIIEKASAAMRQAGVEPVIIPIRGGTDGAKLSYMGLPCPNIFTGGHNFHGRYEYIPIQSMQKSVEVIVNILRISGV